MYEKYTRQALPSKEYRELLGSALCVFNSNNAFVIENILRSDEEGKYNWYDLIDRESGQLEKTIENTITKKAGQTIASLFCELVGMRNRIVHSFQVTHEGKQILATKERIKDGNGQFTITEEYLLEFIAKNEKLSTELHKFRGF